MSLVWHTTTLVSSFAEHNAPQSAHHLFRYTESSSNLVYATTHSSVSILDLRTMRILLSMDQPNHYGPMTTLCLDRKRAWLVTGTGSGMLTLWDLRFGLLLKTWKTAAATTNGSARIHQCVVHPTRGKGRWIMVAVDAPRATSESAATSLIEVWDIETTSLVEAYGTRVVSQTSTPLDEPPDVSAGNAEPSAASAIAALVKARQPGLGAPSTSRRGSSESTAREPMLSGPSPAIRVIFVGHEFGGHSTVHRATQMGPDGPVAAGGRGFMISGSEDRRLRLWDLGKVERTAVLSGLETESDRPTYGYVLLTLSYRVRFLKFSFSQHSTFVKRFGNSLCRDLAPSRTTQQS